MQAKVLAALGAAWMLTTAGEARADGLEPYMWGVGVNLGTVVVPGQYPLAFPSKINNYNFIEQGPRAGDENSNDPNRDLDADGKKRNAYWYSAERSLHRLVSPAEVGRIAARRAVDQVGARKMDTRQVPVVFERGAGETLAGGSGACAAVVVGRLWGRLSPNVRVDLPGGALEIHWAGEGESVMMTGPAVTVFEGWIEL